VIAPLSLVVAITDVCQLHQVASESKKFREARAAVKRGVGWGGAGLMTLRDGFHPPPPAPRRLSIVPRRTDKRMSR